MTQAKPPSEPWRVAVVWQSDLLPAQMAFAALCARAESEPRVVLQTFNAAVLDFNKLVIQQLKSWRPHGVVLRLTDPGHLKSLRRQLPGVPFVSAISMPQEADSCVVADIEEVWTVARDHFTSRGLRHMALYCVAAPEAAPRRVETFRKVVPNGRELVYSGEDPYKWRRRCKKWLRELPKPVGIVTAELGASHLVKWCHDLGLKVPQDVQVIGVDEADECLACLPRLSSICLPYARIGEQTLDVLLGHLQGEESPPPRIVPVSGCDFVARGSTALISAGELELETALKLMEAHACKGISVPRVAELSGIGLTTFYKLFTTATGNSPARHLRKLRLEEACRQLLETSNTVSAIAGACGFSSLESFLGFFRRETGETPTGYRERMAKS
jgi:LacI family transcriptional regulator